MIVLLLVLICGPAVLDSLLFFLTSSFECAKSATSFAKSTYVLSDSCPQFVAEITPEVSKLLEIKQHFCPLYRAMKNGLCERVNELLKTILVRITNDVPTEWDIYLQPELFAMITIRQDSTRFSLS